MVDGSTDKNNNGIVSIVCRYIVEGTRADDIKVVEHVVHMEHLPDRSANGLFALVKRAFNDLEISMNDGLVSQCYDAALVMCGERGGLQTLIPNFCNRCIIYIYCFCHRLALDLKVVLEDVEQVEQYFSTVSALYKFLFGN